MPIVPASAPGRGSGFCRGERPFAPTNSFHSWASSTPETATIDNGANKGLAASAQSFGVTVKNRRSVREFLDREIPEDAVNLLMDAIRWAPSAGNLQNRKFYFVFNAEL